MLNTELGVTQRKLPARAAATFPRERVTTKIDCLVTMHTLIVHHIKQ